MDKPQKKQPKARIVDHMVYGVYIWQLPNGNYLGNENGDYLSISSQKGDLVRMSKLRAAAAQCGYPDGAPVFMAGSRKISDAEYEVQMERMINGELPDEYDVGALKDDELRRQKYGR